MNTKKEIGLKIREYRIRAGLSQAELGKCLNRSHAAISDIERGKTELTLTDLLAIAEYLKTPVIFFLNIQSGPGNLNIQYVGNISNQNPVDSKGLKLNVVNDTKEQPKSNFITP